MNTFNVTVADTTSGNLRTVCLYNGITQDEVNSVFQAAFDLSSPIVGLTDEHQIHYPFSVLAKNPKHFVGKQLGLVVQDPSPALKPKEVDSEELTELVLTDENAEKAFNILDKNGDGYLHKEEIEEVLTVAFNKFIEGSIRFSFPYSCLTAKDVANATANSLLSTVEASDGDNCLDFDDFCAWYLSAGTNALRELLVMAVESLASTGNIFGAMSPRTARKAKSQIVRVLDGAYSDNDLAKFAYKCQTLLRLDSTNLMYLFDLIAVSAKGRSSINHDLFTKIFYVYMLHHNHQLSEEDRDIVHVLDTIFDMLNGDGVDKIPLLELASLLCTITNGKYLQSLKALFSMYPDSHSGFVSDTILTNHLSQVFRVIYYFNPAVTAATGCFPEDLGASLSTKVFLLIDSNRKQKAKLNFEEFTEAFLHGLMMGLNMLHIRNGYFYQYLERLMTYIGNEARRSLSGEEEGEGEGDDVESHESEVDGEDSADYGEDEDSEDSEDSDDTSSGSGDGGGDLDTNAAAGRLGSTAEDTIEDLDLQSGGAVSASDMGEVLLEDSQVAASEVGYEGSAISVMDARMILGLTEYSSKVICRFIIQELADQRGELDQEDFFRGLSKLIGDRYVNASVLTRSKIDFILSRMFAVFDREDSGKCSAVELGCGLLLFCGDDAAVRSRAAWDLLESDAGHGKPVNYDAVVRAVSALIKAQVCLDPEIELEDAHSAMEVRGNLEAVAYFPTQQLDRVALNSSPAFHELFTSTLFMCQSEAMDLDLDSFRTNGKVNGAAAKKSPRQSEFDDSSIEVLHKKGGSRTSRTSSGDKTEDNGFGDGFRDYGMVASDPELMDSSSEEEGDGRRNGKRGSFNSLTLGTFSFDRSEEDEEDNVYTNDKLFPPSAVVLELRAARAILGLESYGADQMMESLAENSPGGMLSESGWLKWLNYLTVNAKTPEQDLSIAIALGNRLFESFDCNGAEGSPIKSKGGSREAHVKYERIAAGLAFMCGGSPLEERLMVAFTVMDSDSDGCITPVELLELIHSALIVISVCSRMVSDKVVLLGAPLAELAEAAAIEAISALNVDDTAAYITLEMLCEMSDDFLKLTALF